MNRDTELPTPGLTVTFIDRILDVTDYVNEQLKKIRTRKVSTTCHQVIWAPWQNVSPKQRT